jgi:hypothetical protein
VRETVAECARLVNGKPRPTVTDDTRPGRGVYLGLFLVTLATVMYEIVLTRIFSVTMWYHFAFVAISVAMFGMTVGALAVYLAPRFFAPESTRTHLWRFALAFGVSIAVCLGLVLRESFRMELSLVGVLATAWVYLVVALPFVFSGVTVCLALTRFPRDVGGLYAVDLLGAALACALVVAVLEVTDGPAAALAAGAIASLGAACFAHADERQRRRAASLVALAIGAFAALHTAFVWQQRPLVGIHWVKGAPAARPLYERWNSFSRVTVYGDPERPRAPQGWGMSRATPPGSAARQLILTIDGGAGTVLTGFDGRLEAHEYLRYDVTALPHWLRRDGAVLVIGPGGGRDILTALLFGQRSVVGVEINGAILDTVTTRFGPFTGHLDQDPRVRFVNDEARSWVARQRERFDIVQMSLIDTWAATAAGAFVLTENSLYTVEAWVTFIERLSPRGLFSVSRWYFRDRPDEVYRLTTLAGAALRRHGIAEPRRHVVIVRQLGEEGTGRRTPGVATMLVSRAPLGDGELRGLEEVAWRLEFDVVLSPRTALNETFAALLSEADPAPVLASLPVNVEAPTDDSPFFFHTLRLRDALAAVREGALADDINLQAVSVLGTLLAAVVGLSVLCVAVPLLLTADRSALTGGAPLIVYFAAIGLGFMLVEISQMQRLIVFLGHPIYGLSVVLFALLASSGVGSALATPLVRRGGLVAALPLVALLGVLALFGTLTPAVTLAFQDATTATRIAVSAAILAPPGLLMGTAFPLGIGAAAGRAPALMPWLWGINGATSVCASVLAVAIALGAGISASFWTGLGSYVVAALALASARARTGA